ncbi:MAG: hypothetical protein PSV22_23930 [Pseudolabrys sp.]|nr:hypothetical protein [Pseudolabrys sp.]
MAIHFTARLSSRIEKIVGDLRSHPRAGDRVADLMEGALRALDGEADTNPDAAALLMAVEKIAGADAPLALRLRACAALVDGPLA